MIKEKLKSMKKINLKAIKNRFKSFKGKYSKEEVKKLFSSRAFKVGSYSSAASIIVIAVAILVTMLVEKLPSSYTQLDMTKAELFTLSDQTKEVVSGLEEEVTIYLIAESGNEDKTLQELLERYKDLNNNIKVETKDPVIYPNFTSNYTSEAVSDNSLIVVSGDKSQYIDYNSIYSYSMDYTTYSYDTAFDGEGLLTSAIDYVTKEELPIVYTLTGHGEAQLSSAMKGYIQKQNIEVQDLNLVSLEELPEDCDALFIVSPASDISKEEKDKILQYLEEGGRMLLVTDYITEDMPNLKGLMENYGVKTVDGLVIEGDASHSVQSYRHYLLPDISSHTITEPLVEGGYYVLMPFSQGIVELDSYRSSLSISDILTTSDDSFSKIAGYDLKTFEKEDGDIDGPFSLGVAIEETVDDVTTQIVWYSSSYILDDSVDEMVAGGNSDLILNSLGWMVDSESTISIHAKSLATEYLTVTDSAKSFWSFVFIGVLPITFLGIGVYVWARRKRA